MKHMNPKMIASIIGISREEGPEIIMNFERSVNIEKFRIFLLELRSLYPSG